MKHSKEYQIHISAIREGEHLFQYVLDMEFIAHLDMELGFSDLKVEVDVKLIKHHNFFELHFQYYGQGITICDRCMIDNLPIKIWEEFELMVKQVEYIPEDDSTDDDPFVVYTQRNEAYYDIYPLLTDLFLLALPSVKQCTEEDFDTQKYCDVSVLSKIQNLND